MDTYQTQPFLSEQDYLTIEGVLRSTARGRAFMAMHASRAGGADRREWQVLVGKMQAQLDRLEQVNAPASSAAAAEREGSMPILRRELQQMGEVIDQARRDIAALKPMDAGSNRILAATGELDAIVSATERATSEILNGAERIMEEAARVPRTDPGIAAVIGEIENQSTNILMACSFQDITGQRITKVVNTLSYIEQRVNAMVQIWGVEGLRNAANATEVTSHRKLNDDRPDAHLLNGPALSGGIDQATVDALFSGIAHAAAVPDATIPHVAAREIYDLPHAGDGEFDAETQALLSTIKELFG